MDYQLRYEKESLYYMPVQHVPCEWCIKDPSTKEEIEKMLTSIDLTCKLDISVDVPPPGTYQH